MATKSDYIRYRDAAAASQSNYSLKKSRLEEARAQYSLEIATNFANTETRFANVKLHLDSGNEEEDWEGKRFSEVDDYMDITSIAYNNLSTVYEDILIEMDIKIESYRESMETAKNTKEYYQNLIDTYVESDEK